MKCKVCNNNKETIEEYALKPCICKKCKICKLCKKDYYSDKEICNKCLIKCIECDKIMLLNNWPINEIKNDKCEECNNKCEKCKGKIRREIIYDNKKICERCFSDIEKKSEKNNKKPIRKKDIKKDTIIGWEKIKEKKICIKCNKEYDKKKKGKDICDKCKKKANEEKKQKNTITIKKNIKEKCIKCCQTIEIKKENNKYNINICKNCDPSNKEEKYRYNNKKQKWEIYRIRKQCDICENKKWFRVRDDKEKKRNECKKCKKKYINTPIIKTG